MCLRANYFFGTDATACFSIPNLIAWAIDTLWADTFTEAIVPYMCLRADQFLWACALAKAVVPDVRSSTE